MEDYVVLLYKWNWNKKGSSARIPDDEVRIEFRRILKAGNGDKKWIDLVNRSLKLMEDTIAGCPDIRQWLWN